MSASASPAAPHRHARILACVLCQHRKIKCDRNSPCSNCIKANVTCVASTPAPARKRRRPNQDLQERLARCEELLKRYADGSAPGQQPTPQTEATAGTAIATATATATATPAPTESEKPQSSESIMSTNRESDSFKPACRMVNDDGSVRFMDSYIWATVYEELQAMRDIVEAEDPEDSSILGSEELTPENNADLFFSGDLSTANLEDFIPDPIHAFKLWQLYLDRVNPLFKVIHVPVVQPMIMDGATNLVGLAHHQQALIFSIYTTAALSLSDSESIHLLGISRESAIQKFLAGTKVALIQFNFLKNYNMTALQALVHYTICLHGRFDRHAAWVFSGTMVRIAQKMGYHRDGEILGLDPYETEMRRRLWWQLIIQDNKFAMLSGLSQSSQPMQWDTKPPSNLNDADIFPGATEKVPPREGPTEMAFVMMLNEIYRFKMESDRNNNGPAFEAAILGQELSSNKDAPNGSQPDVFAKTRQHFRQLHEKLEMIEQKYVDVNAGNVHRAAKSIRHIFMGKLSDMMRPIEEQPEYGTEIFGPKDNLFKIFIMGTEQRMAQYGPMGECGFVWFAKSYFQMDVFAVMTGLLCQHPTGSLANRAWAAIEQVHSHHSELFDLSQKQFLIQAQITLRAWRLREQALLQSGKPIETPGLIKRLRELLPSVESRSSIPSAGATPMPNQRDAQRQAAALFQGGQNSKISPQSLLQQRQHQHQHQHQPQPQPQRQLQQQHPSTVVDPFLEGLLDIPDMNWDMFGNGLDAQDQLSVGMFGYGAFPGSTNGMMGNHMNNGPFQ